MKKKIFLLIMVVSVLLCLFAISVSAVTADNEKGTAKYDSTKALYDENGDALTWYVDANGNTVYELTKNVITLSNGTMTYNSTYVPTAFSVIIANFKNYDGTDVTVGGESVLYFQKEMFYKSTNLTHVYIPSSLLSLSSNTSDPRNTFRECANLSLCQFPKDSNVSEFGKFTFSKSGLKEIYIPASVATFGGGESNGSWGVFNHCYQLQTVTFDKNSLLKEITANCFYDCLLIEEIILPNSVEYVHNRAFQAYTGKGALKKLDFGASFKGFKSSIGGDTWYIYNQPNLTEIYLPSTFIADNCIADWKQIINNSSNAVIYYGGTEEQWDALTSAIASTANNNNNYIVNAKTNSKLQYFNMCIRYYDGHLNSTVTYDFEGEDYTTNLLSFTGCSRCNEAIEKFVCGPLFTNKGYSKVADGSMFTYGISINEENIKTYKSKTGNTFSYGFIVGAVPTTPTGNIIDVNGNALIEKSLVVDFATVQFSNFTIYNVKMCDIATTQQTMPVYCCAYIIDGSQVSYIGNSVTTVAASISSSTIEVIEKTTTPATGDQKA